MLARLLRYLRLRSGSARSLIVKIHGVFLHFFYVEEFEAFFKRAIELKEKHLEREIVDMIEHYEMSPQIIISSFFYLPLLVLADYRPKLKTALLIGEGYTS